MVARGLVLFKSTSEDADLNVLLVVSINRFFGITS